MPGNIFVTSAYLPPVEYFSKIVRAEKVFIEAEENYRKQSYRNRCYILTSQGPGHLVVPVFLGSFHKTPVRDIRIDYTRRWQKVHIGALASAYGSSAFFIYYFGVIEEILLRRYKYLLDLNMDLLTTLLKLLNINVEIKYTKTFMPVRNAEGDFRYSIDPKKESSFSQKEYFQVFRDKHGFVPQLSIIDLIFNMGPGTPDYL